MTESTNGTESDVFATQTVNYFAFAWCVSGLGAFSIVFLDIEGRFVFIGVAVVIFLFIFWQGRGELPKRETNPEQEEHHDG